MLGAIKTTTGGLVGESAERPDGIVKTRGEFAYSSDLNIEGMLWGATTRSPHAAARIKSIDTSPAEVMPGVLSVLTHEDVPGSKLYGLEHADQPVLAFDEVRFYGEPIAIVAADHPETARRAAEAIDVTYEVLEPVTDMMAAADEGARRIHDKGNITRHVPIRFGPQDAQSTTLKADVIVKGTYEVGMQDQAFLGPESGLCVPDGEGGVDLYIATQWLHVDQQQLASVLNLPESKVRLTLAGVGGAFGAREDLSMQAHCCMLALKTGRPVKMMYGRTESFLGHVHRHPARMEYEHGADSSGKLIYVKARILLDGGAYSSSSPAVAANAACFAVGPYEVESATIDSTVVYTNNPPCGAMRGFGAVQVGFAHESQMDLLAQKLGMHPLDIRMINAMTEGTPLPTGQVVPGPVPVKEILKELKDADDEGVGTGGSSVAHGERLDITRFPGGAGNTTRGEGIKRGTGWAIGFKNVGFAEGFDDYSTARVRLWVDAEGEPVATVHTAGAEVGQGLVTVQMQIARTELGVDSVVLEPADTAVGSAGSSSASRQTYMTGGAVKFACERIRTELVMRLEDLMDERFNDVRFEGGDIVDASSGDVIVSLADALKKTGPIEQTHEHHHRRTFPLDPITGQGDAHLQLAFSAHRCVADVDVELGLVKLIEVECVQDVGRIMNPISCEGQIEGGTTQGIGLALMEEIQTRDGKVMNASFTDYLIPTMLDVPPIKVKMLELADPEAPYGLRGVGEPPTISSTPAVVAALRSATGRKLERVPVTPEHICGI